MRTEYQENHFCESHQNKRWDIEDIPNLYRMKFVASSLIFSLNKDIDDQSFLFSFSFISMSRVFDRTVVYICLSKKKMINNRENSMPLVIRALVQVRLEIRVFHLLNWNIDFCTRNNNRFARESNEKIFLFVLFFFNHSTSNLWTDTSKMNDIGFIFGILSWKKSADETIHRWYFDSNWPGPLNIALIVWDVNARSRLI